MVRHRPGWLLLDTVINDQLNPVVTSGTIRPALSCRWPRPATVLPQSPNAIFIGQQVPSILAEVRCLATADTHYPMMPLHWAAATSAGSTNLQLILATNRLLLARGRNSPAVVLPVRDFPAGAGPRPPLYRARPVKNNPSAASPNRLYSSAGAGQEARPPWIS